VFHSGNHHHFCQDFATMFAPSLNEFHPPGGMRRTEPIAAMSDQMHSQLQKLQAVRLARFCTTSVVKSHAQHCPKPQQFLHPNYISPHGHDAGFPKNRPAKHELMELNATYLAP
jgi:hypothetical protein